MENTKYIVPFVMNPEIQTSSEWPVNHKGLEKAIEFAHLMKSVVYVVKGNGSQELVWQQVG